MNKKIHKNKSFVIYCDIDGVLASWEGRVKQILGDQFDTCSKSYKWAMITKYNNEVQPFYETLDKIQDADDLWNFLNETFQYVTILSASGNTPRDAHIQKRNWIRKHFGEVNTIIVRDGGDKAKFANNRTILIDDREKVLKPFRDAGGIGIFHTTAKSTINEITKLLNQN